jgi:tetratricopeptide (TPR) repeat protein
VLIVRMRQAEVALADGRLEEAYRLIQSDSLRSHRRGQLLINQLAEKFLQRGQAHLAANRSTQALADCEKAQALAGNRENVLALRSQIEQAVISADRVRRNSARAGMIENAAQLVDSALAREDLDRATAELIRARANGCNDHQLRNLDGNVRKMLTGEIQTALRDGRLDRAQPLMSRLSRLDPDGVETLSLDRMIEQICSAWSLASQNRPREAHEILCRVAAQLPDAKWIKDAINHLATAEESLQAVRIGPLGLLNVDHRNQKTSLPPVSPSDPITKPLPQNFVLQIDGAGSYLVLRKSLVTIGPISSSQRCDVALIAEPSSQIISIERIEDDYFLRGTSSKLLNSGDRISLSPRCTMSFTLPNASSTTAALDLVAGRFPRADLRRVVLLDRDLIIGPGASSNVRADHLQKLFVMQLSGERLICDGRAIEPGVPTKINDLSFVITG